MKQIRIGIMAMVLVTGCDAAQDVRVLPLPSLTRPTAESRLGLPEVQGVWRFAGWEIIQGDSASLERTFPSFGTLSVDTQRLDSIAGTFQLAGGPTRVIGDVRRTGLVTLVTIAGGRPSSFLAGAVERDTLWLEMTSVLAADEWPREARAAFVRGEVTEPIAWLRGARVAEEPPPPDTTLTGGTVPSELVPGQPGAGLPAGIAAPGVGPSVAPEPGAGVTPRPGAPPALSQPQPGGVQPSIPGAGAAQPPAGGQPTPAGAGQQQAPPQQAPPPEPEPEVTIPEPDIPPLLGDPVVPGGR